MRARGQPQALRLGAALFRPDFKADRSRGKVRPIGLDVGIAVVAFSRQWAGPGERDRLVVRFGEGLALILGDQHNPICQGIVIGEGRGHHPYGQAAIGQQLGYRPQGVIAGTFVQDTMLHGLSPCLYAV